MESSLSMDRYHLYAQKMNNSAALCIEVGHYDRAISSLAKALRLSREHSDERMMGSCHCYQCSLDGCIAFSEINPPPVANNNIAPSFKDIGYGYVYRRPIRIPPLPIIDNHNMGKTLFLIITFNLAMAHHLSAMCNTSMRNTTNTADDLHTSENKIKKSLQLYELAYNWYSRLASESSHEHDDDDGCMYTRNDNESSSSPNSCSSVASIRFYMIISNNLSHIHRLGSNYTKHRQCLEHLLSTVMLALEYKTRTCSSDYNDDYDDFWCTDLDGFIMNVSPLFLQERCAEAA